MSDAIDDALSSSPTSRDCLVTSPVSSRRAGGSSSSTRMRIPIRRRLGSRPRFSRRSTTGCGCILIRFRLQFCRTAAVLHGVSPDMVMAGNGSDDLLTILTRAFVGPGDLAGFPSPSYLLYSTLVALQDGRSVVVPYQSDWGLDSKAVADPALKLFWLANPDSPSGTAMTRDQVGRLAASLQCPLVVDEAYADFAEPERHSIPLIKDHANVIVTRSFSKGYGLAGVRLGYLVARPELVEHLFKLKDSYNCDTLSQVAGIAALLDQDYLRETRSRIIATRGRLTGELRAMGYTVPESQSNFVWATQGPPARETFMATQGPQGPGSADDLSGASGRPADHDRHRRRDRPAARNPQRVELNVRAGFRYNHRPTIRPFRRVREQNGLAW